MKIISNFSPNYSKELRLKSQIKFVIFHYTGMQSEIESINRLKNPKFSVSCHYLINKKGLIIQMVSDKKIAWHAGQSKWKNYNNLNSHSIGIELTNKGHEFGYENYPNTQIKSLIYLCQKLKKKYKIKSENFLGHSDIAPTRKVDPGERFPWKKLSKFKIGNWCKTKEIKIQILRKNWRLSFFKNIYKIGYRYFNLNKINKKDQIIIKAFQRRYLPNNISGKIDEKTLKFSYLLANLNK